MKNYYKYLGLKLHIIELLSVKGKLQGDPILTKIHDICIANPNKLDQIIKEK